MIISISGKLGSGKDLTGQIIQYLYWLKDNGLDQNLFSFEQFLKEDYLKNHSNFEIKKFADKLKDIVCMLINCSREQLEDRDFKEKELGEEWDQYCVYIEGNKQLVDYSYYLFTHKTKEIVKLTPRLMLQLLGTDCGRNIINPNIWINSLFADMRTNYEARTVKEWGKDVSDKWIITDTRFPNELEAVKKRGGITIRVKRPKTIVSTEIIILNYSDSTEKSDIVHKYKEHPSETALDNAEFDYVINNTGTIEDLIYKVREILIKEKVI